MQEQTSRRLLVLFCVLVGILSVCAIAIGLITYRKISELDGSYTATVTPSQAQAENQKKSVSVFPVPQSAKGFVGLPVSLDTSGSDQTTKKIVLKGVWTQSNEPDFTFLSKDDDIQEVAASFPEVTFVLDQSTVINEISLGAPIKDLQPNDLPKVNLSDFKLDALDAPVFVLFPSDVNTASVDTSSLKASQVIIYPSQTAQPPKNTGATKTTTTTAPAK